ncbi:hypothetical protein SH580_02605 [Coraliomargarita algicola]|uniref:Uncharacterized protein n=1 Tax=Coraliomargarita algicola TaxID=3092156 RepID=A0ABZ0RNX6_9BACT|nr:hypothetical protein [Coraliomargarita sp. J2-16]WPJ96592.1 hypothetical protein SH580_02605 [Coraliomargarita sp. J2-16]
MKHQKTKTSPKSEVKTQKVEPWKKRYPSRQEVIADMVRRRSQPTAEK